MDIARQLDELALRVRSDSVHRYAWVDGKHIFGAGIINDKGPMAAWMIAADAIRKAGVPMRGDLILTMVPGEIDQEPVDEFTSSQYLSKEVGARYLITRGVVADYALVAEGTHFQCAWTARERPASRSAFSAGQCTSPICRPVPSWQKAPMRS
jgi:hypothetical protein